MTEFSRLDCSFQQVYSLPLRSYSAQCYWALTQSILHQRYGPLVVSLVLGACLSVNSYPYATCSDMSNNCVFSSYVFLYPCLTYLSFKWRISHYPLVPCYSSPGWDWCLSYFEVLCPYNIRSFDYFELLGVSLVSACVSFSVCTFYSVLMRWPFSIQITTAGFTLFLLFCTCSTCLCLITVKLTLLA